MNKDNIRNKEIYAKLQELYPQIFSIDNPKLLKIGVHKDIKSDGKIEASSQEISRFFHYLCKQPNYTTQQVLGNKRYNLLGEEEGEVTQKDLETKATVIANIVAKRKALKQKQMDSENSQKPEDKKE